MKRFANLSLILLLIFGTLFVISCEKDPTDPENTLDDITYTGYKDATLYTLKITQAEPKSKVYAPQIDDTYTLTSAGKTSNGTIHNINGSLLYLKSEGAESYDLTATVSGNHLQNLSGIISWTSGSEAAPGNLTATAGEAEPPFNLCDYYVFLDLTGAAPAQMTYVTVQNISSTQLQPIPTVQVKIGTTNLTYLDSDEYQADGEWYFEWYFYWINDIVAGTTYNITLQVDDDVKTSDLKIVYTPVVTTNPANFVPTQTMTYNWTLTENAREQGVLFDWNAFDVWAPAVQEITLAPSARTWSIAANTVPSTWNAATGTVDFTLIEVNYTITGNTAFVSNSMVSKYFEPPTAPTRSIDERDIARKLVKIIKNGK